MTAQLPTNPVYIPLEAVEKVLTYEVLIPKIEEALGNFSRCKGTDVQNPLRTVIPVSEHNGFSAIMPVYSKTDDVLATKIVNFFPCNKDVPTHQALVILFDVHTGVPRALLEGNEITSRRTAAASAVATKYLVNGQPSKLAILGSGVEARSHYKALSQLFTFEKVNIWNHRLAGAEKLAAEIGEKAEAFSSAEEAVKDADVIVTVTSSSVPVLMAKWVKPGAHINAIGACTPSQSELEAALVRSSVVYGDSYEGATTESGDIVLAKADVYAEIGEVINGSKEARRSETTIFKSLGIAIEDAVAAKVVLNAMAL